MKNQLTISLFLFLGNIILFSQSEPLPFGRTTLFAGSGLCEVCHASDGVVLTVGGQDISMVTYWRSTMMGNASKDPFWRAVVAEEVHRFPTLQQTIETTCTKCHSPMGYTEAIFNGATNYSMAQMKADPIANDGVSCAVCHQIKPDNFGMATSYSGHYKIYPPADSIIYGPYQNPELNAMTEMAAFLPVYTTHLNQSELCATCHTLFTPYLDNQGQIAGDFPEQTPYIEWKNSIYPAQNTQCQDCHMPMITDSVDIASIPQSHQVYRAPFWKHSFVGGNVYMLNMLKNNISTLGLTASSQNFDSTIARAEENLTKKAIDLFITTTYENDSLTVFVKIENKTGHKIPGGIPFRRMWIHLKVTDPSNNIIYESGKWNLQGEIIGLNSDYEPHYNLVRNEDEVQIYEGVMVDVDQAVTYTLLRASSYIKDNRIPPKGFTTSHPSYDTTAIFGSAVFDPNFNKENLVEGTGSDIVNYRIPVINQTTYKVFAEICFQTIKPRAVEQFASISEPDITQFVGMYNALPNIPFIMKSDSLNVYVTDVGDDVSSLNGFELSQNYPNPFNPNTQISYQISVPSKVSLNVYDVLGNEVATLVDGYKSA
ncbi:MAG: multiheme c-type cytochrome, partial [Ignavibacteria bacterium]|nr:multiheme c-type cytochrome [Ignavibacteria bacterium]